MRTWKVVVIKDEEHPAAKICIVLYTDRIGVWKKFSLLFLLNYFPLYTLYKKGRLANLL